MTDTMSKKNNNSVDIVHQAPSKVTSVFQGEALAQCFVGLCNLNNTCYLNATIQALLHIPHFFEWASDPASHRCHSLLCVSCSLKRTVNEMCSSSGPFRPASFVALLRVVWPGFNINVQQDAHEFLLKLLEQVRHDFCRETKLSVEEVDIHKYPLGTVFAGWLQTSGFCKCTRSTKVYELVDHLNLPLCTSVQEALRKFTNTEEVNDFKCPSCDSINSYSRKIDILHEPEVLILQLKRFDSSTDEKCDDCVTIDMDIVINEASFTFVSCVAHLGPSRKNGHYICITRCPDGSFVQFNDHNVSKTLCAPLSLMSRNGYLIFYKRNPVESKLPQSLGSLLVRNEPLATSTPNKVTPLKIKRRHRQGQKETSFQSSNIYELQAKSSRKQLFNDEPSSPALNQDGLKRSKGTVTPIKILGMASLFLSALYLILLS